MGLLRRGGPAPRWRAWSLEAGLLRLRAEHARTSACGGEVGWWWISLLPGAPYAMRARSGRGRHARGRQERRAPPSRTPPRSRTSRFYRALCADDGPWRTRALQQPPPRPAISADPIGRRARPVRPGRPQIPVTVVGKKLSTHLCTRAWTRPRTHKWQPSL